MKKSVFGATVLGLCIIGYTIFMGTPKKVDTQQLEAVFNQANRDSMQGRYNDALVGFQRVIQLDSSCAVAYFNCGLAAANLNDHAAAVVYYKKALSFKPHFISMVHFNCGVSFYQLDKVDEAVEQFKATAALQPHHVEAHAYAGKILHEQHKLHAAIGYMKKAAQLNTSYTDALVALGASLRDDYQFDEAIDCFKCAITCDSTKDRYYLFLGDVLNLQGKMDAALKSYKQALVLNDACLEAAHNAGMILVNQHKPEEGKKYLDRALHINPDFISTHIGLSCVYLRDGDFERGWAEYEWRLKQAEHAMVFAQPQWDGSSLKNKTILLHAEQGFGDTLHFVRYTKLIKEKYNAHIYVLPQKQLVDVLKLCPYIDLVLKGGDPMPHFDVHASIMSLPHLCKTTIETIPAEVPYLYAQPELVEHWQQRLASDTNVKIGICWHVNPSHDYMAYSHKGKKLTVFAPKRSIPLDVLAQLADLDGVSVYSLQRFNGLEEIDALDNPQKIHVFGDDFDQSNGRFMDTAAVIKNLDLVVSVDTSVAHLAGALGVPTWILLPYPAEWRWLTNRSDTPWYPTMQLFRQPIEGDWRTVMQHVKQKLLQRLER